MLHNEIRTKVFAFYTVNNGRHPNTLLISSNLYDQLIMTAPVTSIRRNRDGAKTFNGMRILIVQNTIDLLQVIFLQD